MLRPNCRPPSSSRSGSASSAARCQPWGDGGVRAPASEGSSAPSAVPGRPARRASPTGPTTCCSSTASARASNTPRAFDLEARARRVQSGSLAAPRVRRHGRSRLCDGAAQPAMRCGPSSSASHARSRAASGPTAGRFATGSSTRASLWRRASGLCCASKSSRAIPACRSEMTPGRPYDRVTPNVLRTAPSVTCSSQSTTLPSSCSWMAMWVIAAVGAAPCQCFSPGEIHTTSPGRISSTGPPSPLHPAKAGTHNQRLTEWVRVPGGASAWLERDARAARSRRGGIASNNGVDADCSRKPLRMTRPRRLRSASLDLHVASSPPRPRADGRHSDGRDRRPQGESSCVATAPNGAIVRGFSSSDVLCHGLFLLQRSAQLLIEGHLSRCHPQPCLEVRQGRRCARCACR